MTNAADIIAVILGAEIDAPPADTTPPSEPSETGATDETPPAPPETQTAKPDAPQPPASTAKFELGRVLRVTKPLIKGEDVKAVQAALIAKKYHCGINGASGVYNADTAHAVRMFQSASRLIVNGQVDKFTARKLGGAWIDKPTTKQD